MSARTAVRRVACWLRFTEGFAAAIAAAACRRCRERRCCLMGCRRRRSLQRKHAWPCTSRLGVFAAAGGAAAAAAAVAEWLQSSRARGAALAAWAGGRGGTHDRDCTSAMRLAQWESVLSASALPTTSRLQRALVSATLMRLSSATKPMPRPTWREGAAAPASVMEPRRHPQPRSTSHGHGNVHSRWHSCG
jgi:hypothetical protein